MVLDLFIFGDHEGNVLSLKGEGTNPIVFRINLLTAPKVIAFSEEAVAAFKEGRFREPTNKVPFWDEAFHVGHVPIAN